MLKSLFSLEGAAVRKQQQHKHKQQQQGTEDAPRARKKKRQAADQAADQLHGYTPLLDVLPPKAQPPVFEPVAQAAAAHGTHVMMPVGGSCWEGHVALVLGGSLAGDVTPQQLCSCVQQHVTSNSLTGRLGKAYDAQRGGYSQGTQRATEEAAQQASTDGTAAGRVFAATVGLQQGMAAYSKQHSESRVSVPDASTSKARPRTQRYERGSQGLAPHSHGAQGSVGNLDGSASRARQHALQDHSVDVAVHVPEGTHTSYVLGLQQVVQTSAAAAAAAAASNGVSWQARYTPGGLTAMLTSQTGQGAVCFPDGSRCLHGTHMRGTVVNEGDDFTAFLFTVNVRAASEEEAVRVAAQALAGAFASVQAEGLLQPAAQIDELRWCELGVLGAPQQEGDEQPGQQQQQPLLQLERTGASWWRTLTLTQRRQLLVGADGRTLVFKMVCPLLEALQAKCMHMALNGSMGPQMQAEAEQLHQSSSHKARMLQKSLAATADDICRRQCSQHAQLANPWRPQASAAGVQATTPSRLHTPSANLLLLAATGVGAQKQQRQLAEPVDAAATEALDHIALTVAKLPVADDSCMLLAIVSMLATGMQLEQQQALGACKQYAALLAERLVASLQQLKRTLSHAEQQWVLQLQSWQPWAEDSSSISSSPLQVWQALQPVAKEFAAVCWSASSALQQQGLAISQQLAVAVKLLPAMTANPLLLDTKLEERLEEQLSALWRVHSGRRSMGMMVPVVHPQKPDQLQVVAGQPVFKCRASLAGTASAEKKEAAGVPAFLPKDTKIEEAQRDIAAVLAQSREQDVANGIAQAAKRKTAGMDGLYPAQSHLEYENGQVVGGTLKGVTATMEQLVAASALQAAQNRSAGGQATAAANGNDWSPEQKAQALAGIHGVKPGVKGTLPRVDGKTAQQVSDWLRHYESKQSKPSKPSKPKIRTAHADASGELCTDKELQAGLKEKQQRFKAAKPNAKRVSWVQQAADVINKMRRERGVPAILDTNHHKYVKTQVNLYEERLRRS